MPDYKPEWKKGPSQRRSELDGSSPQQREAFARWIERKVRAFPELIAKSEAYSKRFPEDTAEPKQRLYWINALAFARFLTHLLRTEKVRGLAPTEDKGDPDAR